MQSAEFRGKPLTEWLKEPEVVAKILPADDAVPNNPRLPVMLYRDAVVLPEEDPAAVFEALFGANHWGDGWRNGIFPYPHFHCTAHEALGIFSGAATVRLGGEAGIVLEVRAGDVAVLPAGVCHQRLSPEGELGVVGAYPAGQRPDQCRPDAGRLASNLRAVGEVPVPARDPAFGPDGPLLRHWSGG